MVGITMVGIVGVGITTMVIGVGETKWTIMLGNTEIDLILFV